MKYNREKLILNIMKNKENQIQSGVSHWLVKEKMEYEGQFSILFNNEEKQELLNILKNYPKYINRINNCNGYLTIKGAVDFNKASYDSSKYMLVDNGPSMPSGIKYNLSTNIYNQGFPKSDKLRIYNNFGWGVYKMEDSNGEITEVSGHLYSTSTAYQRKDLKNNISNQQATPMIGYFYNPNGILTVSSRLNHYLNNESK